MLYYCECREEILQKLAQYMSSLSDRSVTPAACKKLMISIGFGGTLYGFMSEELGGYKAPSGEWGDYLNSVEVGMRSVRDTLAEMHPALLKSFADRPHPKASLLYSLYEREEWGGSVGPTVQVETPCGSLVAPSGGGSCEGPPLDFWRPESEC